MRDSVLLSIVVLFVAATAVIAETPTADELGFDEIIYVKRKPYSSSSGSTRVDKL